MNYVRGFGMKAVPTPPGGVAAPIVKLPSLEALEEAPLPPRGAGPPRQD